MSLSTFALFALLPQNLQVPETRPVAAPSVQRPVSEVERFRRRILDLRGGDEAIERVLQAIDRKSVV